MPLVSDHQFRLEADRALEQTLRAILPLAEREAFDADLQNGVLQLTFDLPAPATFVVSAHAPARQIWVSARSRSYRLGWNEGASAFTLGGDTLPALLERLALEYLHGA